MPSVLDSPPHVPSQRLVPVAALVLAGAMGSAWALTCVLVETVGLLRAPGRTSVDELVVAASSVGALALLGWVCLGLLVSVTACVPGRIGAAGARLRDAVAPDLVRRAAAVLLGISVLGACAPGGATGSPTAAAAAAPSPEWGSPTPTTAALGDAPVIDTSVIHTGPPAPEWTPSPVRDLPPVTLTAPRVATPAEAPREVTVHRGDTLWDLAAARLSAEATDAEIAQAWQRWWAVNRDVIGPDPDLILPGQVLRVPEVA